MKQILPQRATVCHRTDKPCIWVFISATGPTEEKHVKKRIERIKISLAVVRVKCDEQM